MFNDFLTQATKQFPKLKIKYKDESSFMKCLSFLLFFNKSFQTDYITTIGNTIYYPSRKSVEKNELSAVIVLMHELTHIYDSNKITSLLFSFLYLFPQILAIISLVGFMNPYMFAFALCLLPIPSLFRAYFEFRAYVVSMYVSYYMKNNYSYKWNSGVAIDQYVTNFIGWNYYLMFPFKKFLISKFYSKLHMIKNNQLPLEMKLMSMIDAVLHMRKSSG